MAYDPIQFSALLNAPATYPPGSVQMWPSQISVQGHGMLLDVAFGKIDGTAAYISNWQATKDLIIEEVAKLRGLRTVADIAARDADSQNQNTDIIYHVVDASADPTVDLDGAVYIYDAADDSFLKIAEFEQNDFEVTWSAVQAGGGPASSAAAIDAAVANSHPAHANRTQLDKISETNGVLYYDNKPVVHWTEKQI